MTQAIENLSNHELIESIKGLVAKEKLIDSEILMLLKVVKRRKIHLREGYGSLADYCALVLGMSEDQAWKRSQAVDTISSHPWALEMLKCGETKLTQLAMIKPKLTKANEEIIRDFIPGKSKAEVKAFLETVGLNGERLEPADFVEVKIRVKKSTIEKMQRVRALKSKSRHMLPMEDIHEEVYAFWLSHHCPVEKARRAKAKAEKKAEAKARLQEASDEDVCASATPEKEITRYVKAKVRHAVMASKEPGCDFTGPDGRRCGSMYKLQFEHARPYSLGGDHTVENGKKLCGPHNQYRADLVFGRGFMDAKRRGGQSTTTRTKDGPIAPDHSVERPGEPHPSHV